jgi:hypothetical protein
VLVDDSARKHQISDEDMKHAVRNHVRAIYHDDLAMLLGPARDWSILEIGVVGLDEDFGATIIHAMPARRKYLQLL